MPEKKKQKKNGSQCCKVADKVDVIYDILSAHKLGLESLEKKIDSMSPIIDKLKSRLGL